MNKDVARALAGIVLVVLGVWGGTVWSELRSIKAETTVIPGSVEDPVVTKSYVDQKLAAANGSSADKNPVQSASNVEVVSVPVGQRLVATDGAEFIVRAGKAVAYSADTSGISDLTDGIDITNGKPVPNNHLILSPRAGRGVQPSPEQKTGGLVVVVRGGYKLVAQS